MKRFGRVCVGSAALALGIAIVPTAAGVAQASTSQPMLGGVSAPRVVNLRAVSRETATAHPSLQTSARYFNPSAVAANRAAAVASGGRHSGLTALAGSTNAAQAASAGQTWDDFPVTSLDSQISQLGDDQAVQPPDTQLAAGPGVLVEAINDSTTVWSKTGSELGIADLNLFFGVPSGQSFTDPRVLYDTQAGVFLMSGWSLNSAGTDTQTYLAVSQTSNPFGNWTVYTIASSTSGVLTDQPMTGVCNDKVVVAWNEYTAEGATFAGAQALVLQKSVLTAGTALASTDEFLFTSTGEFRFVPAQSLSSTTTCWMALNNADNANLGGGQTTPALGVYAITGTPDASDVTFTETQLPVAATTAPPEPRQPSGATDDQEIDDRMLTAVWQNGVLWTSLTDGCTPSGDSTVRDCMRIDEVNAPASGTTPTLALDTDLSQNGLDEYYPAVGLDSAGNLYVSYTASSPTLDPGAYAVVSSSSSLGTFSAPVTVAAGKTSYDGTLGGFTARWGDYSDVAADPSEPGTVWATGEYAPSDANEGDWGTATAMLSLTAPPAPDIAIAAEGKGGVPYAQAPQFGAGWHSLGGAVVAPPAVAAATTAYGTSPAAPLFIATGTNEHLYIRSTSSSWQEITPVASCLGGPGAMISTSAGVSTLTVACEGTNKALYYNTATVTGSGLPTFSGSWKYLGGGLTAAPAVAQVGGVTTFFVRGDNGHIYTRTVAAGFTEQSWACIGSPAAAAEAASTSTIFACEGTDHALWYAVNGGIGWSSAVSLGGVLTAGPALALTSRVPYFLVEGAASAVYERTLATSFTSFGGVVIGGVGAAALN